MHVRGAGIELQLALLGTRVKLSPSVVAAIFTPPTRFASFTAFSDQAGDNVVGRAAGGRRFIGTIENCRLAPPCRNSTW